MSNPMQEIFLSKVTANMGIGASEDKLDNAKALLKKLTGRNAAFTIAKNRFPEFGIKKGQIIGTMVTLRNDDAAAFLKSALDANNNTIAPGSIANNSVNFGIKEYIYFSGIKYDPKIGMLGLNINASFSRKGARIENRKRKSGKASKKHKQISNGDIMSYLEKNFGVKIAEKER